MLLVDMLSLALLLAYVLLPNRAYLLLAGGHILYIKNTTSICTRAKQSISTSRYMVLKDISITTSRYALFAMVPNSLAQYQTEHICVVPNSLAQYQTEHIYLHKDEDIDVYLSTNEYTHT